MKLYIIFALFIICSFSVRFTRRSRAKGGENDTWAWMILQRLEVSSVNQVNYQLKEILEQYPISTLYINLNQKLDKKVVEIYIAHPENNETKIKRELVINSLKDVVLKTDEYFPVALIDDLTVKNYEKKPFIKKLLPVVLPKQENSEQLNNKPQLEKNEAVREEGKDSKNTNTEDSKKTNTEESKATNTDESKETNTEESKEKTSIEESKETSIEERKEEPKVEPKEEPKVESKEVSKEEPDEIMMSLYRYTFTIELSNLHKGMLFQRTKDSIIGLRFLGSESGIFHRQSITPSNYRHHLEEVFLYNFHKSDINRTKRFLDSIKELDIPRYKNPFSLEVKNLPQPAEHEVFHLHPQIEKFFEAVKEVQGKLLLNAILDIALGEEKNPAKLKKLMDILFPQRNSSTQQMLELVTDILFGTVNKLDCYRFFELKNLYIEAYREATRQINLFLVATIAKFKGAFEILKSSYIKHNASGPTHTYEKDVNKFNFS
jgi:hypothetical protein